MVRVLGKTTIFCLSAILVSSEVLAQLQVSSFSKLVKPRIWYYLLCSLQERINPLLSKPSTTMPITSYNVDLFSDGVMSHQNQMQVQLQVIFKSAIAINKTIFSRSLRLLRRCWCAMLFGLKTGSSLMGNRIKNQILQGNQITINIF